MARNGMFLLLGFVLLGMTALGQDSDTAPPELVDFEVLQDVINVTDEPQELTVTLTVTDNLSGVDPGRSFVSFRQGIVGRSSR